MSTTIIISDLHLGTRVSRTDMLAQILDTDYGCLILNGDTIDSLNFKRFRSGDWQILKRLQAISREGRLVLIRGNHDKPPSKALNLLEEILGTDMKEEYELDVGGRRYLVLHGDQFDSSLNLTWVGDVSDWCYQQIQGINKRTALWLKGRVKHLGGIIKSVQDGAVLKAKEEGYAGIITGHTHHWCDDYVDGIHYLNTGCWVEWPCSYIRITDGSAWVDHWPGST